MRNILRFFGGSVILWSNYTKAMNIIKSSGHLYLSPTTQIIYINIEGALCSSVDYSDLDMNPEQGNL